MSYHTTDFVLCGLFVVLSLGAAAWYIFGRRPGDPPRQSHKPDYRDRNEGLHANKFSVIRTDGSSEQGRKHEHCHYFVLDLDHDKFARAALKAYAAACCIEYPKLAKDLDRELRDRPFRRDYPMRSEIKSWTQVTEAQLLADPPLLARALFEWHDYGVGVDERVHLLRTALEFVRKFGADEYSPFIQLDDATLEDDGVWQACVVDKLRRKLRDPVYGWVVVRMHRT